MAATLSQTLDRHGAASAEKKAPEDDNVMLTTRPREPASSTLPQPLRPHALAPRSDVAYVPEFVSEREEEALLRHLQPTTTRTAAAAAAGTAAAGTAAAVAAAAERSAGGSSSVGPPPPPSLAPGWKLVSGRRLRVLGGSVQGGALTAAELPSWLLPLIERLRLTGAYAEAEGGGGSEGGAREGGEKRAWCSSSSASSASSPASPSPPPPNHALVNCYASGEGIMPHEDGPLYHPAAAIVSLGSWAVLRFYSKRSEDEEGEEEDGEEGGEEGGEGKRIDNRNVFSVALAPRSLVVFTGEAYKSLLHGIAAETEEALDASVLNREDEGVRRACREAEAVSPSCGGARRSLRVIPRGGGGGEGGGAGERISLTVRRVLRVRRNLLLRLGPRLGPR